MKALLAGVLMLIAAPVAAQSPAASDPDRLSIRATGTVSWQRFAAASTFGAAFGHPFGTFLGGGVQVARRGLFAEVAVSTFEKTGQRGFVAGQESFGLDTPLTVTITPVELIGGYRFRRVFPRYASVTPYVGGGIGSYGYKESTSEADPGEDVQLRHAGVLVVGGVDVRVHRWMSVAFDVQVTHVPGILGDGGTSKEAGETDLGGVAARVRLVVGR